MMEYEVGDKVVVEITEVDEKDKELTYGVGNPTWIRSKYILGKLSDFTKPEKIKFSEAEMEEFNDIRSITKELLKALTAITRTFTYYPRLKQWILEKDHPLPRNEREILFARAWEHPELIEVVKEKKYHIHILNNYISKIHTGYRWVDNYLDDDTVFTQSEINKIQKMPEFRSIDLEKYKEEIEYE